ncbi:MAG: lipid-A-disaccharide synthase [Pseudomonadales bacterium]|nr:lipid-A-disaccharide synthase [Pseudomonadales bacterium]
MIFGIVAGEASGDRLGAGLMRVLRQRQPGVRFVGIGGPLMLAEGLESLAHMDRLAVNGFVEPVRRLPDLVRLLRLLYRTFTQQQPTAFIGVDFNVFNFLIERLLKRRGVPTVHYVSPSVYAWRRGRVRAIARSTDLLLTLYPFEPAFYDHSRVRAVFVGHPLADEITPEASAAAARQAAQQVLEVQGARPCIAVLPGSRMSEVKLMTEPFLDACEQFRVRYPQAVFVIPALRESIEVWLREQLKARADLPVIVYRGNGRLALTACDAALVKSGTSTLEAMLLHRPMVVSYRLGEWTYQLVRRLLRTPYVALPNILAGRRLVAELLQHEATGTALADELARALDKASADPGYLAEFHDLHLQLRRNADDSAAAAVLDWLDGRSMTTGEK